MRLSSLLLILLVLLGQSTQGSNRTVVPQFFGRYCDTASPLSFVWIPQGTKKPQKLLPYTTDQTFRSSTGMLAVLASDDDGNEFVAAYKSGKRLLKKYLRSTGNTLAGWYRSSIVVVSDGRPVQVALATGELTAFAGPQDTGQVDSLSTGDVFVRFGKAQDTVELRTTDARSYSWQKPLRPDQESWTVVGNRYLALSCSLMRGDNVFAGEPRLWLIDLENRNDRLLEVRTVCGLTPGRKPNELLIGSCDSRFRVEALDLKLMKRRTLLVARNTRSELVGLSVDKKWLLLHTGYADVGPGYLWAVNLVTHKTVRIQENVYGCTLSSP